MTKKLLVFTKHFPYNMGETAAESYLETEIGYLAEAFDEVMVIATEAPADRLPVQRLPENVRSASLGCVQTKGEKAACLVVGLTSADARAREAVAAESILSARERAFQCYFAGKALRKWRKLVPVLEGAGFIPTWVYSFWLYDTALMAVWAKQAYPCARAVARAHGYDLYRDRSGVGYLPCRELLLDKLDAVLPCSEDGAETLRREYPSFAGKVTRAYLGTRDLPDLSGEPKGDPFRVVSCSRAVPVKRLPLLRDAMALLDAEGARILWTHYGDGPDLAAVRDGVAGFSSVRAEFPGNVPNAELLGIYASRHIDLFVNASVSEGLPISIMEASGHGVPVVATDVGGTSEIVRDGASGALVPEGVDAAGLAVAIRYFYDMDSEVLAGYRRAARRSWVESFQTKENVGILLDALRGKVN
ncbi:glycosyltransferase [uncultured Parolsenella sp.]|uniref:glycosyltransferase n=1 Tax=uncultured Parolsenella sp. TaxID=2083008 RepID=UPI0025F937AD|nr:glycosyltransferase [uncultured Parolsenella sp.]